MAFSKLYDITDYGFLPNEPIKSPPFKWEFLQPIIDGFNETNEEFRSLVDLNIDQFDLQLDVSDLNPLEIKFIYSFYEIFNA